MTLAAGHHPVPAGHLAAVVTYLEMTAAPQTARVLFPKGFQVARERLAVSDYQELFRKIGTPWLWQSRLTMASDALETILRDDAIETWIVRTSDAAIGLVELDFRVPGACELAFFGLQHDATGKGLGRPMMALAQQKAFGRKIARFHVHTCTLDAPQALGFYQKHGFVAYKREVEVFPDPRLGGTLPIASAGHIPCLK